MTFGSDREAAGISMPTAPSWHVLAILSALMGFASISTDLYLPAMPAMGKSLHADAGQIEWTVSGYLVGFSLGQLLWGPIGDRYGRRASVAAGLLLFIIGSGGCALAETTSSLIGWRIVQAVGACASVALSRAMVRDLYEGQRSAQMMSTLITVMAIAPLLGPLLGGQIIAHADWRAIFWTLVGIGAATLAALFTLPETLPADRRNQEPLGRAIARYGVLFLQPRLLGYAGVGGFFYAGAYAYIAGTPFAYITYYHVPEQFYGLLFALGIVGIMLANTVNVRLLRRFRSDRILAVGVIIVVASGIDAAIAARTGIGGLWGLVVPLFVFMSCNGFIVANSITGALSDFPERAGAVSSLIGAVQYGSGIIGSGLVGLFADGTPWPMGWVIAATSIGSLLSMWLLRPRSRAIHETSS
jgi:DHA1 family bicyclomycin/chloramphenicol resistance-like MFS transporter